jgi:hypothetical protein
MGREKSESLIASAPTRPVVVSPESRTIPASKEDYLFKNEKKQEDQISRELRMNFEARMQIAQQQRPELRRNENLSFEEQQDSDFLNRITERHRRHSTPDGEIVIWCRVKSCMNEPGVSARSLVVPADLKEKIPSFESNNDFIVQAVFRHPTAVERKRIDPFLSYEADDAEKSKRFDHEQHCLQLFRLCFVSWNLPFTLERSGGRLTDEAMEVLRHGVHPCLLDEIGDSLFELIEPTDIEIKQLQRQCDRMFAKDSKGIKFACEGIRAYCDASSTKDLGVVSRGEEVSWRTHLLINLVLQKKNEIERKEMEEMDRKSKAPSRSGKRIS